MEFGTIHTVSVIKGVYMKKFIITLCTILSISAITANAATEVINADSVVKAQERISNIGFRILNNNSIEKRMVFYYDTSKTVNATTSNFDRHITLYRGLYTMLSNDDEVAAVLSHEISHGVDSYKGVFRGALSGWSYAFAPRKYEYKADKLAVDYMANAGYNPVALIVVMNKSFPQRRYEWCDSHPITTRRTMEVYEYIYKKYPEYLVNNTYKNNVYYQNFLLTSKENRAKFQQKIETKSKGSVNYL